MKRARRLALAAFVTLAGCAPPGVYTSIRHVGENTYLVTVTEHAGPGSRLRASLLRCLIRGARAECVQAAVPSGTLAD